MGQNIGKEKRKDNINEIIEECYDKYFSDPKKQWNQPEFFHAVCDIVETINRKLGSTQIHVPDAVTLEMVYNKHHKGKKALEKKEFQKILQDLIIDTSVTGMGIKDMFLFIFGIPIVTTFIKDQAAPKAVPNEVFIPGVTSATVLLLAKLRKI